MTLSQFRFKLFYCIDLCALAWPIYLHGVYGASVFVRTARNAPTGIVHMHINYQSCVHLSKHLNDMIKFGAKEWIDGMDRFDSRARNIFSCNTVWTRRIAKSLSGCKGCYSVSMGSIWYATFICRGTMVCARMWMFYAVIVADQFRFSLWMVYGRSWRNGARFWRPSRKRLFRAGISVVMHGRLITTFQIHERVRKLALKKMSLHMARHTHSSCDLSLFRLTSEDRRRRSCSTLV